MFSKTCNESIAKTTTQLTEAFLLLLSRDWKRIQAWKGSSTGLCRLKFLPSEFQAALGRFTRAFQRLQVNPPSNCFHWQGSSWVHVTVPLERKHVRCSRGQRVLSSLHATDAKNSNGVPALFTLVCPAFALGLGHLHTHIAQVRALSDAKFFMIYGFLPAPAQATWNFQNIGIHQHFVKLMVVPHSC